MRSVRAWATSMGPRVDRTTDFFSVSLSVKRLSVQFGDRPIHDIVRAQSSPTFSLKLTPYHRRNPSPSPSFSAPSAPSSSVRLYPHIRAPPHLIFTGIISDRFGRKWPLVYNLILVALFELGTGFVRTFPQFLAVRSLFGIGMGGVWGLAASTALESLPVEVRGLASGILQQGVH